MIQLHFSWSAVIILTLSGLMTYEIFRIHKRQKLIDEALRKLDEVWLKQKESLEKNKEIE